MVALLTQFFVLHAFLSYKFFVMPYPQSPFKTDFPTQQIFCYASKTNHDESCVTGESENFSEYCKSLLKWLCSPPRMTTYRVNTLMYDVEQTVETFRKSLHEIEQKRKCQLEIERIDGFPEVLLVRNVDPVNLDLQKRDLEVVVDVSCGEAVLRGAHVFAPGVMGIMSGIKIGDKVSVYADMAKKCKKGLQKLYDNDKLFVGNGIAKMVRHQLFGENLKPVGIAVEITDTLSGCLNLDTHNFADSLLLQNLPSMICVHILDPQPGETILDMCAAPGNKTTHASALMKNQGTIIAIDKTPNKVKVLQETCRRLGATNVQIYLGDSTKLSDTTQKVYFEAQHFDRVLLDAPCSALGKRPQLVNTSAEKVIRSYVPLQRKLFANAVQVLKIGGVLVYSTCTVTVAENEGLVSWALRTFDCLEVVECDKLPVSGGNGVSVCGLSDELCLRVLRFGPDQRFDTVGFFIAKFLKIR